MTTHDSSLAPSLQWQLVVALPPTSEPEQVAERLVLLAHYGVDWSIWGPRRARYWDALMERVKAATYSGPTLNDWWSDLTQSLTSNPRNPAERKDVTELLQYENQRAVLKTLRNQADITVLRVRVIAETRRNLAHETDPVTEEGDA